MLIHYPLVSAAQHFDDWALDDSSAAGRRGRLLAAFARHRVVAVFAGHEHHYQRLWIEPSPGHGFWQVTTGGGGSPLHRISRTERRDARSSRMPGEPRVVWHEPRSVYHYCRLVLPVRSGAGSPQLEVRQVHRDGASHVIERLDLGSRPGRADERFRSEPSPRTARALPRPVRRRARRRGLGVVLLAVNAFLLLAAYYIIKPLREALILSGSGGAEIKSYSAAGQALLLLFLIPAYGRIGSRVSRIGLITWVTLFFISNLFAFYGLGLAKTPLLGIAFFLWVGIFNVMIVAQFWAFANDFYTPEQGKRLFALVAVGRAPAPSSGRGLPNP